MPKIVALHKPVFKCKACMFRQNDGTYMIESDYVDMVELPSAGRNYSMRIYNADRIRIPAKGWSQSRYGEVAGRVDFLDAEGKCIAVDNVVCGKPFSDGSLLEYEVGSIEVIW